MGLQQDKLKNNPHFKSLWVFLLLLSSLVTLAMKLFFKENSAKINLEERLVILNFTQHGAEQSGASFFRSL